MWDLSPNTGKSYGACLEIEIETEIGGPLSPQNNLDFVHKNQIPYPHS